MGSDPAQIIRIKLPKAFPGVVALLPLLFFGVFLFGLPRREMILFVLPGAVAFSALLWLPRIGYIELDHANRVITFKESISAAMFHPWRRREINSHSLIPGDKVVIGTWQNSSGFVRRGVLIQSAGKVCTLLESEFAVDGSAATGIREALDCLGDLEVTLIRLDADYRSVPWEPQRKADHSSTLGVVGLAFGLSGIWVTLITKDGMKVMLLGLGLSAFYALFLFFMVGKQKTQDGTRMAFNVVRVVFSVLQFGLIYTMLTLVGMRWK